MDLKTLDINVLKLDIRKTLFVTPLPHYKVGEDLVCGRQILR